MIDVILFILLSIVIVSLVAYMMYLAYKNITTFESGTNTSIQGLQKGATTDEANITAVQKQAILDESNITANQTGIASLNTNVTALTQMYQGESNAISALSNQYAPLSGFNALSTQFTDLSGSLSNYAPLSDLTALNTKFTDVSESLSNQYAPLSQFNTLNTQFTALSGGMSKYATSTDFAGISNLYTPLSKFNTLSTQLAAVQSNQGLYAKQTDLTTLTGQISGHNTSITNLSQQLQTVQNVNTGTQNSLNSLTQQVGTLSKNTVADFSKGGTMTGNLIVPQLCINSTCLSQQQLQNLLNPALASGATLPLKPATTPATSATVCTADGTWSALTAPIGGNVTKVCPGGGTQTATCGSNGWNIGNCPPATPTGRYVKVFASAVQCLNIAQIQVYSTDGKTDVALNKTVTMSSGWNNGAAGPSPGPYPGTNVVAGTLSLAHTSCVDIPWLLIDLGTAVPITKIIVHSRTDCCTGRMAGFATSILDVSQKVLWTSDVFTNKAGLKTNQDDMSGYTYYTMIPPSTTVTGT